MIAPSLSTCVSRCQGRVPAWGSVAHKNVYFYPFKIWNIFKLNPLFYIGALEIPVIKLFPLLHRQPCEVCINWDCRIYLDVLYWQPPPLRWYFEAPYVQYNPEIIVLLNIVSFLAHVLPTCLDFTSSALRTNTNKYTKMFHLARVCNVSFCPMIS